MGIDVNGVQFLAFAKSVDVDFTETAMIGRQNLYISREEMRQVIESFGDAVSEDEIVQICEGSDGFSEALLKHLGAMQAHSFDYSAYQKATYVHDMNEPIPDKFKEQYTTVLDGGSLEHVFNFPVAIKNCMEMVKVGGHYLAITPANNFFGHGFYQFSPELYFAVFSEDNGFKIEKMIAFEEKRRPVWYSVKSPREVSGRVTLCNSFPVYLLVIAKKVSRRSIFANLPQQSDYTALWSANYGASSPDEGDSRPPIVEKRPLPIRLAKVVIPSLVRRAMRRVLERRRAPKPVGFDPLFFEPIDPTSVGRRLGTRLIPTAHGHHPKSRPHKDSN
jgi:hypothetical protein